MRFLISFLLLVLAQTSCLKKDCTADSQKVLGEYRCVEPRYVIVHEVYLNEITSVDPNGEPWVEEGSPEMYIIIDNYGSIEFNGFEKPETELPAKWEVGRTFMATESINVGLYQIINDGGSGMGGFTEVDFGNYKFSEPTENGLRYPELLPVKLRHIDITLYLELEWVYE